MYEEIDFDEIRDLAYGDQNENDNLDTKCNRCSRECGFCLMLER
jgi:hypothetical protein